MRETSADAEAIAARQELKRLLDPDGMGSDLRALVQAAPATLEAARTAFGLTG